MPGTITINQQVYPFDEELFAMYFADEPDLLKNAMVRSGAMLENAEVARLIANGSNLYTFPFYKGLADDNDDNYNGSDNITLSTLSGGSQTGVVYGRAHAWKTVDFIADFTAANPMAAIAARMAGYWRTKRQRRLIGITESVLSLNAMASHTVTATAVTPTLLSDSAQKIWGDRKDEIGLAIMHSAIAQQFENLERVEYLKYTDPNGIERSLPVYQVNGLTVIIDDGVPHTEATTDPVAPATYTTYLFARGAIHHAEAPVAHPFLTGRDELTNGGYEFIGNRLRETIHPNGFSYNLPANTISPTDAQLFAAANWELAYEDAKMIPFGKIVSPAATA